MKRIISTITLVLATTFCAFAQTGINIGYVHHTAKSEILNATSDKTISSGFYVGLDYGLALGAHFDFLPGVFYRYLSSSDDVTLPGGSFGLKQATARTANHEIVIPLEFKYNFILTESLKLFIDAGPRVDFELASKTKYEAVGPKEEIELPGRHNNFDNKDLRRFNVGVSAGVGIDISELFRIKFGYNYGFLDMNKSDAIKTHNYDWHVGLALVF